MRTRKALFNSITSLLLQLVSVICSFILPRMILATFGSVAYGAASSISQFLGYITLLESGVGGITRAALFKPLAERDSNQISGIVNATQEFFKKLAFIFVIYTMLLACSFKYISASELEWFYTFSLVLILSASTFAQYYFGTTYSILLQADQNEYIPNCVQIATTLANTFFSVILLIMGFSFHVVKLVTAFVYTVKPIALRFFVKKHYCLDSTVPKDYKAIEQRWSGLGQHLAFFVHNNTDIIVITLRLGLQWVSVYSVYYLIVNGISRFVNALTGCSEAAFGNMIAKNEKEVLYNRFHMVETLSSMIIISFFTTTGLLLFDFIKIYTQDIKEMNFVYVPIGILFVCSEGIHCIKQIYHSLVLAAGHYKQTQFSAFMEAGLNLVLSFGLVTRYGISGVLLATIIATVYRTVYYAFYLKKNIIFRSVKIFFVRVAINLMNVLSIIVLCNELHLPSVDNYIEWSVNGVFFFILSSLVTLIWNLLFYRNDVLQIIIKLKSAVVK